MKRDYSLDFLRVIACILVIVIHVANVYCRAFLDINQVNYIGAVIFNTISRVSVPIFFMISGSLLIKETNFNLQKYLKRIWRLLIVLVVWNLIYFVFNNYYLGENVKFVDAFFESFVEPTRRHLWFMYAIIGIYISLPFVQRMCNNMSKIEENLFVVLWSFFVGIIYIVKILLNKEINYPIPIIQGTYYLGYFIIGHILYKRADEIKQYKKWHKHLIIVPVLCFIITTLITCLGSFEFNNYFNSMLAYRTIFYILSSSAIFLVFVMNKEKFKDIKIISSISGLSFGIYLIHPVFLLMITENIAITEQLSFIFIPIYTIIIFIASYISCLIIKKIPVINKIFG